MCETITCINVKPIFEKIKSDFSFEQTNDNNMYYHLYKNMFIYH